MLFDISSRQDYTHTYFSPRPRSTSNTPVRQASRQWKLGEATTHTKLSHGQTSYTRMSHRQTRTTPTTLARGHQRLAGRRGSHRHVWNAAPWPFSRSGRGREGRADDAASVCCLWPGEEAGKSRLRGPTVPTRMPFKARLPISCEGMSPAYNEA